MTTRVFLFFKLFLFSCFSALAYSPTIAGKIYSSFHDHVTERYKLTFEDGKVVWLNSTEYLKMAGEKEEALKRFQENPSQALFEKLGEEDKIEFAGLYMAGVNLKWLPPEKKATFGSSVKSYYEKLEPEDRFEAAVIAVGRLSIFCNDRKDTAVCAREANGHIAKLFKFLKAADQKFSKKAACSLSSFLFNWDPTQTNDLENDYDKPNLNRIQMLVNLRKESAEFETLTSGFCEYDGVKFNILDRILHARNFIRPTSKAKAGSVTTPFAAQKTTNGSAVFCNSKIVQDEVLRHLKVLKKGKIGQGIFLNYHQPDCAMSIQVIKTGKSEFEYTEKNALFYALADPKTVADEKQLFKSIFGFEIPEEKPVPIIDRPNKAGK